MKKITSVNVVTQTDMTVFYKDIEGISAMIENNGSEVEIQYQFHNGYYSALVIGRKED
jgi:hypothetical protein